MIFSLKNAKKHCFFNILIRIHITTTYQVVCGYILVVYDDSHIQNLHLRLDIDIGRFSGRIGRYSGKHFWCCENVTEVFKMLQTVRGTPQLSFDGYGIILRPIQTDLSNIEISKQIFF